MPSKIRSTFKQSFVKTSTKTRSKKNNSKHAKTGPTLQTCGIRPTLQTQHGSVLTRLQLSLQIASICIHKMLSSLHNSYLVRKLNRSMMKIVSQTTLTKTERKLARHKKSQTSILRANSHKRCLSQAFSIHTITLNQASSRQHLSIRIHTSCKNKKTHH